MCDERTENCTGECQEDRKFLLTALVIGGAALVVGGVLLWNATPNHRADRLLTRAQKKLNQLEDYLATLAE
jgi:hypothetical protein